MEHPKQTQESMAARIMRFDELKQKGIPIMFIDSMLPGHQRMNYAVIGDTAAGEPGLQHQTSDHGAAPFSDRHGLGAARLWTRLAYPRLYRVLFHPHRSLYFLLG